MLIPGIFTTVGENSTGWQWQGTGVAQMEGEGVALAECGHWTSREGKNITASRHIFFIKEKIIFRTSHATHTYACTPLHKADGLQGTYTCGLDAYSCTFAYDAARHIWRLTQTITGPHKNESLWWEYSSATS